MLNEVRHTNENCLPPSAEPGQTNRRGGGWGGEMGCCWATAVSAAAPLYSAVLQLCTVSDTESSLRKCF